MASPLATGVRAPAASGDGYGNKSSDGADELGLGTRGGLADLELDTLAFIEAFEAVSLDCFPMDEDVSTAAVDRDEAETFIGVEPFDSALCQQTLPAPMRETH
jgi:hypothetical protein